MSKLAVTLVQAPAWGTTCPPYGLAVLKSYLESLGHPVTAMDLNVELYHEASGFLKEQWAPDKHQFWMDPGLVAGAMSGELAGGVDRRMREICRRGRPVVGLSLLYSNQHASLAFARRVKAAAPEAIVIVGGPQAGREAAGPELARCPDVDYVVQGEGEETFAELLGLLAQGRGAGSCRGLLFRKGAEVVDTGDRPLLADLGLLPFADYGDFENRLYSDRHCLPTSLSRGCPNQCAFCYEMPYWRRFRVRKAESLLREVAHQRRTWPLDWLWFHDSLINGHMRELGRFAEGLVRAGPVRWASQAVIRKEMTRDVLRLLKDSGCISLNYGLESASFAVMLKMGKVLAKGSDLDRIVRDTFEVGIDCILNFMFGFPGETEEEFQTTLDFVRRNKDHITMVQPSPGFCDFHKGTYGHRDPEKFGIELREGSAHWVSRDGRNTYLTRMERFERFLETVHDLKIQCSYPHRKLYLRDTIIGNYYRSYGEPGKAVPFLRRALASDPPNPVTAQRLKECVRLAAAPAPVRAS